MGAQGPLAPGDSFGNYKITGVLGRGGMGAVYRAHDPTLGRDVAIKVVFREFSKDPLFLERFAKEQASAGIKHPNVVAIHGSGVENGLPYLVMELLPGGTLSERMKREGRLPWKEVARLGSQIASALAAVHAAKLVHRDLKPHNVLLDEQGDAKLADFGVVRTEERGLTKTGELLGTPQYMAPEQVEASKHVDWRADMYSLGATLYAVLVGHPPFDGPGFVVINKKLNEVPSSASSEVDDVPRPLDDLILQLLERDPRQRMLSAEVVASKLDAIARGRLGGGSSGRRAGALLLAIGLLVAAAAAGVAFAVTRRGPSTPPPPPPPPPEAFELVLDEPKDGALVAGSSVKVAGRVKGGGTVQVNDAAVAVGPDGAFATSVPVQGAEASFTVAAAQGAKKDAKTRTVYRPPEWVGALEGSARPPLPLPRGLSFGATPGEYVNRADGSVLVFVPPAVFDMGGSDAGVAAPAKKPQPGHVVRLSPYFIGKYEVSVAQFDRFAREKRFRTYAEDNPKRTANFWFWPAQDKAGKPFTKLGYSFDERSVSWRFPQRTDSEGAADPTHPAVLMVAADADAYCAWAGLKLPTEAQWECAASWDGVKKRRFPWGDKYPDTDGYLQATDETLFEAFGVRAIEAFPRGTRGETQRTVPVTANAKGASPVGALNMAGNVAEWCRDGLDADFYAECAAKGEVKDPCCAPREKGPRVHRGGHFASRVPEVATTRRFYEAGSYSYACDTSGFRVCREYGD